MTTILVKTGPLMQGHVTVEAEPAAVPLIRARPDVWWYCVVTEDDGWHRGGAWDVLRAEETDFDRAREEAGEPPVPTVPLRPVTQEEEDEDGRW